MSSLVLLLALLVSPVADAERDSSTSVLERATTSLGGSVDWLQWVGQHDGRIPERVPQTTARLTVGPDAEAGQDAYSAARSSLPAVAERLATSPSGFALLAFRRLDHPPYLPTAPPSNG